MPPGDPQPGEVWATQTVSGLRLEAEVLLRATPHDLATMPDSLVVFRYTDRRGGRAWTLALRNFLGMFAHQRGAGETGPANGG